MTSGLSGHRMTTQRRLLLDLIRDSGEHLDADDLYRRAKEKDARISLSTVYRNLSLLKELGVVVERSLGEDHHYYEVNTEPEHHHLVCLGCGEIFEFSSTLTERMKSSVKKASRFHITRVEINMQGYCTDCQEKYRQ